MKTKFVSRLSSFCTAFFLLTTTFLLDAGAKPPPVAFCGTMDAWARRNPAQYEFFRAGLIGTCPTAGPCDTPANRDAAVPDAGTPFKLIQLRFHVFADDDGANQVATLEQIASQVERLNVDFFPARCVFHYTAQVVSNSTYRVIETNQLAEVDQMKNAYAENPGSQINCFVIDYGPGNCGVATFPWQADALTATGGMLLDRVNYTDPNFVGCLTHEMGHTLGLLHTFRGVTEVVGCTDCRELASRSVADGDISGDFCSDTQPEPGVTDTVPPCPPGTNSIDTCNSQPWTGINTSNHMSYYVACYNNFTPQQLGRMHCWTAGSLGSWLRTDWSAPSIAIVTPTNTEEMVSLSGVFGWVTDDWVVQSVTFTLREIAPYGGTDRWWNGSSWVGGAVPLPAAIVGTNWINAGSVTFPPLNSGVSYEITATATDGQFHTATHTVTIHAPVETLVWDPGTTHLGTEVKVNPHTLGGPFYYKIVAANTTAGGWRTALNVSGGEANVYLAYNGIPSIVSYAYKSDRAGSDGFVLHASQFAEGQEWYYLVQASAGTTWNLVSGEPYVLDLGTLPGPAESGDTNVVMGAEGTRFFRTYVPSGALAWRLWLHGRANNILVKKGFIPLPGWLEMSQASAMLLVPDYLVEDLTYFVAVQDAPGTALTFHSKEQPITDVAFTSVQNNQVLSGYPYTTYRVPVPIDQIAWEVRTEPVSGDPSVAIRREKVPNEFNNSAFSEVPGAVMDSVTLVPPTLSDGIFYITTYGSTNCTFHLRNGEPVITERDFISLTTNDLTTLAGWRFYRVGDVESQVGYHGWELLLSNQPASTEIALRANAVPGRWSYRDSGYTYSGGHVTHSDSTGWLQRPGHQADIWYVGIYQPAANLGAFRLTTRAITPTTVSFNGSSSATDHPATKWRYFRIDVPADAEGWDLRLTGVSGGNPQLTVRRDLVPESPGGWINGTDWPSGYQLGPSSDWTGYYYEPDGRSSYGRVLAVTRNNPLVPGTYYVGVRDEGGSALSSFSLVSRGIGTNYVIGVSNLNFSGPGSAVTNSGGLWAREVDYYRLVIPPNQPNWLLRLTTLSGEAMLALQQNVLPNSGLSSARTLKKLGKEHYLLLPDDGQEFLAPRTNGLLVVSEGMNPNPDTSRIGTNFSTYRLESLGVLPPETVGTGTLVPVGGLTESVTLEGGQVKLFQFEVAAGVPALEIRLLNRVGNPSMTVRFGTNAAYPHVPAAWWGDRYGADGGYGGGRLESYDLINIANPPPGIYTMTIKAEDDVGGYPDASCDIQVLAVHPAILAFDGGLTSVTDHLPGTWRYFTVTVPPGAQGWDLRLADVDRESVTLHVRRDLLPEASAPAVYAYGEDWPSGQQLTAGYDWTGLPHNYDWTNEYGHILTMGRNNPLTNGTYYVGAYNGNSSNAAYTVASRGIGAGFTIGVSNLAFAGSGSSATNSTGLFAREADYYTVVVPPNARSWHVRVDVDGAGEALLIVEQGRLPNVFAGNTLVAHGKKMMKLGKEHFALFPEEGQEYVPAGTYHLAAVSEGLSPHDGYRVGPGSTTYVIQSLGEVPVTDLGNAPTNGGPDLVHSVTVEGGALKVFQFTVAEPVSALEVRLLNRVGNPSMTLRLGTNVAQPEVPLSWWAEDYGVDGGWTSGRLQEYFLLTLANPLGTYTMTIRAEDDSGFPDAACDISLHAVGGVPVAFDGGTASVSGHLPQTWQYFSVEVPPDALGWDLRLDGPIAGQPILVVRRDVFPNTVESFGITEFEWPSGAQSTGSYEFTGLNDPDGASIESRTLIKMMGHPLSPGTYIVGVYNYSSSANAAYVVHSRGMGGSYTIPITPLAFSGSATVNSLPAREYACFQVDVPAGVRNWKLRLNSSLGGESLLVLLRDYLPTPTSGGNSSYGGRWLNKEGHEQFVLLESEGETPLTGGTYYLAAISQGTDSANHRAVGDSSFTLESQGEIPITDLGTVPAAGSALTHPTSMEGGEVRAFQFTLAADVPWLEVRMTNRLGSPTLALCPGTNIPAPQVPAWWDSYGAEGGFYTGRMEDTSLLTLVPALAGTYTLAVRGGYYSGEYPDASATIHIEQVASETLEFTNGLVAATLADGQSAFYQVTVPPGVLGWKLDLHITNGTPVLRARKDFLPTDAEPGMSFGGPSVVIVPPYLQPGTWFVEVRGSGASEFGLHSDPALLTRPAWDMPLYGHTNTTPGLTNSLVYADTGVDTNGVPLPGDGGTDLGNGDFHYYALNVPEGNVGLLRTELYAISGDPNLYIRRGDLPTLSHFENGYWGGSLIDYSLVGTGTEYGNWTPLDGKLQNQIVAGTWYLAIHAAGGSNVRYRMRMSLANITNLTPNVTLTNQLLVAGDWRHYRVEVPTNAPADWTVTFSQQQGDVIMHIRDTVPPGDPYVWSWDYRNWLIDGKNDGPYSSYDPQGSYTFNVPPVRPGHVYYIGFRAQNDASFTVGYTFSSQTIAATNQLAFYGGVTNFVLQPNEAAQFYVPVPADASRWQHYVTNAAGVNVYIEQGTVPDLTRSPDHNSYGSPNTSFSQALYGWPWVSNQNYYVLITNTTPDPQPVAFLMDGRNCANDDEDNDGLPDCWEITWFGNTWWYNGASDPDNDGVNNATEYLDNTNPMDPTSMFARLTVVTNGPGGVLIDPLLPKYAYGATVTLTASPDPTFLFLGWTVDGVPSMDTPLVLAMTTNHTVTANFGSDYGLPGETRADYRFQSNLVSSVGTPPDLTLINSGSYYTNLLGEGGYWHTVLRFEQGTGLQLQPTLPVFPTDAYTLVMLVRLDDTLGWKRLLDFKNATEDYGLYDYFGSLYFYPGSSGDPCLANDTWHQIVVTRDAATTEVVLYCDGVPQSGFFDTFGDAVISGDHVLRFFKDDSSPSEDSSGYVARIRTFATPLTPSEVAALDRFAEGTPSLLTADYRFQNTLASSIHAPPDLAFIGEAAWFTDTVVDDSPRAVLRFEQGEGLRLQPTGGILLSNEYTVALLFRFDDVSSWRRIFDPKNATIDLGLYAIDGALNFWDNSLYSAVCLTNDTWHQIVVTRDGSDQVEVYCDGVPQLSFVDSTGIAVISPDPVLRFFKDDSNEESGGFVARIRTFATALTPTEVAALGRLPVDTPAVTQNSVDVKNCANHVTPGSVDIAVPVFEPTVTNVTVTFDNGFVWEEAVFASGSGNISNFTWIVTSGTLAGPWMATVIGYDTTGQATTNLFTVCVQQSLTVFGVVGLEGYVGVNQDGTGTRDVVFTATDGLGTVLRSWTNTLDFTPSPHDYGMSAYLLSDVPEGTTHLSAKTAWHLRKRLELFFADGAAPAFFMGPDKLLAGDINDSNLIDPDDYYRLAASWYLPDPAADIDGSGAVDLSDYFLLSNHWLLEGDAE